MQVSARAEQLWSHNDFCRSTAKGMSMNKQTIALALAGAMVAAFAVGSATTSSAAPVSSGMTAFKQATLSDVTDVRYYRRGYYGRRYYNPGAAIGLGILGAAAG